MVSKELKLLGQLSRRLTRLAYSIPIKLASVRVCVRSILNNLMTFTIYCQYIANFMVSKELKLLAHLSRRLTR